MKKLQRIEEEASRLKVGELRQLVRRLQGTLLVQEAEEQEEQEELKPARAHEVVAVKHPEQGVTIKQELVRCGKRNCRCARGGPLHGPYWYKYWNQGGKTRSKYLGKKLPTNGNGNGNGAGVHAGPPAARVLPGAAHK